MSNQAKPQDQQAPAQAQAPQQNQQQNRQGAAAQSEQHGQQHGAPPDFDGLKDKKPEELTPEELRWMADTMPGEGPGD